MKIEFVRFDNINSLCGHFEVDFTHPSLTDPGIFVITGPTGVGKTSLLDAVSFALYGRTARQKGVTPERDELMTHGAPFCKAELRFEKDGRRYIVSTEHRRKKSGIGFGQQERRLEEITADGTTRLLANQVRDVSAQVEKITGLGFDNFFRCMMLAQGKFAQFMEADAPRRSEVLSTITGTEIYQAVGETVADHCAALEKELEAIQLQEEMSPEKRRATEDGLEAARKQKEAADAQLKTINDAIKWLSDVQKAEAVLAERKEAQQNAQQALDDFTEDGSAERLKQAEAALMVQPAFIRRDAARQAETTTRTEKDTQAAWLAEHQQAVETATQAESEAAEQLEKERPGMESTLQHLREVVRPLENKLNTAKVAEQAAIDHANDLQQDAADALTKKGEAQSALTAAQEEVTQARAALKDLVADAVLTETMPVIQQRLKDWNDSPDASLELPDSETLHTRQQALTEEKEALLDGRDEESLPVLSMKWKQLSQLDAEERQARADLATAQKKQAEAQAALEALDSVEDAEKIYATCREATQLTAQVANLEEQLNTLYLDFKAGKYETCPCCGSPTPHERHVVPGALQAKQEEEQAALQELNRRKTALLTAQRAWDSAHASEETATRAATTATAKLAQALADAGWDSVPSDLDDQRSALTDCMTRLAEIRQKQLQVCRLLAVDEKRVLFLQELLPCTPDTPQDLASAKRTVRDLETRLDTYRGAERAVANAEKKEQTASIGLTHAETMVTTTAAKHALALTAVEKAAQQSETCRQALAEQWQGEDSATVERDLLARLKNLQEQYNTAHTQAEAVRKEFGSHQTLFTRAETQLPELEQARTEAESALTTALAQAGLADEAAYDLAMLHVPARHTLQQRLQSLRETANTCKGATGEAAKALESLQKLALTQESAEQLLEQSQQQQQLCHETDELVTSLRSALMQDDAAHRANKEKEDQAADLKQGLDAWNELREVLGKTKDGFKKYAQQITFDILVQHANAQLRHLSERYTLISDPEQELALRVLDRCQDENGGRACSNLSGGETFIVSLALALGLSRMAGSKTSIDTLFLDEGFGTLDENSLERVLSSLQTLRAGGKLVGIISHVEKLQARLSANIALSPCGSTGLSTFLPHPAVLAQPTVPSAISKKRRKNRDSAEKQE